MQEKESQGKDVPEPQDAANKGQEANEEPRRPDFFEALEEGIRKRLNRPLWRFIRGKDPIDEDEEEPGDGSAADRVPAESEPVKIPPASVPVSVEEPSQPVLKEAVPAPLPPAVSAQGVGEQLLGQFQQMQQARAQRHKRMRRVRSNASQMEFTFPTLTATEEASIREAEAERMKNTEEPENMAAEPDAKSFSGVPQAIGGQYASPPPDLWNAPVPMPEGDAEAEESLRQKLQTCLDSFYLDAEVESAIRGPRILMYRVYPGEGVPVAQIASHSDDMMAAVAAETLRVEAPVPGEKYVGVEVPNPHPAFVGIGELFGGEAWRKSRANIPLALGRNTKGADILFDLCDAPHLLIGGATGSGKSYCLNALLASMIVRFAPEDLRLVLVDPKQVEMRPYARLPHLLVPLVTDVRMVGGVLNWLRQEMERRYALLGKVPGGIRNIQDYNRRTPEVIPVVDDNGEPVPAKLPYIVLVVDELGDIMLTAGREVETGLSALAAKARAVGIHVILATQQPSVKVVTGTIKANFPARIAFRVTSLVNSRVILDFSGAETLLGKGDMLFRSPKAFGLQRIQGAAVSDEEIERMVQFVEKQFPEECCEHSFDVMQGVLAEKAEDDDGTATEKTDGDGRDLDPRLAEALRMILQKNRCSASMLQSKLGVGYGRASKMIAQLEAMHAVGEMDRANNREVLATSVEEFFPSDAEPPEDK